MDKKLYFVILLWLMVLLAWCFSDKNVKINYQKEYDRFLNKELGWIWRINELFSSNSISTNRSWKIKSDNSELEGELKGKSDIDFSSGISYSIWKIDGNWKNEKNDDIYSVLGKVDWRYVNDACFMKLTSPGLDMGKWNYQWELITAILNNVSWNWIAMDGSKTCGLQFMILDVLKQVEEKATKFQGLQSYKVRKLQKEIVITNGFSGYLNFNKWKIENLIINKMEINLDSEKNFIAWNIWNGSGYLKIWWDEFAEIRRDKKWKKNNLPAPHSRGKPTGRQGLKIFMKWSDFTLDWDLVLRKRAINSQITLNIYWKIKINLSNQKQVIWLDVLGEYYIRKTSRFDLKKPSKYLNISQIFSLEI